MISKVKQLIFLDKIKEIHGDSIEITTPYLGSTYPVSYKCGTCGDISEVKRAAELVSKKATKRKHNCRKCFWNFKHKKYKDDAKEKALEKLNKYPNVSFLKDFRDTKENRLYFELLCKACEHKWTVNATSNIKSKWKGCPECWKKSKEFLNASAFGLKKSRIQRSDKSKERFFETLKQNKNIILKDRYIDAKTNLTFQCSVCENKWETSPGHIVNSKSGCPSCNSGQTKAKEEYLKVVEKIHGDSIEVLEDYINANTKISHKCTYCNSEWKTAPSSIKAGHGCPICKISKGEKQITNYLKQNNIHFIPQWKEHECRHYKILPFDFYLPDCHLVIEFQGIQHERFSPPLHKTIEDLKKQQKRDQIKKDYCNLHTINFLEIWYYQFDDIEKILNNYLFSNKKTA
jgi:hypothetical protein